MQPGTKELTKKEMFSVLALIQQPEIVEHKYKEEHGNRHGLPGTFWEIKNKSSGRCFFFTTVVKMKMSEYERGDVHKYQLRYEQTRDKYKRWIKEFKRRNSDEKG